MSKPGPCALCDKDPAEGVASVWTPMEGEMWFCHGDEHTPTCYELATWGTYARGDDVLLVGEY